MATVKAPKIKESQIEKLLTRMVKRKGGLCYKFQSPGDPGVPDRIVITPDGRVYFCELKLEFGYMANIQIYQKERLTACGAEVRVLKGVEKVQEFVKEVFF